MMIMIMKMAGITIITMRLNVIAMIIVIDNDIK